MFHDCRLTAADGVENVPLSRPWRPYAQAVFINCELGKHISAAGWDNWGKASNEQTVNYAEYNSKGPGANPTARAPYSRQLTDPTPYAIPTVLAGNDGWNPLQ